MSKVSSACGGGPAASWQGRWRAASPWRVPGCCATVKLLVTPPRSAAIPFKSSVDGNVVDDAEQRNGRERKRLAERLIAVDRECHVGILRGGASRRGCPVVNAPPMQRSCMAVTTPSPVAVAPGIESVASVKPAALAK